MIAIIELIKAKPLGCGFSILGILAIIGVITIKVSGIKALAGSARWGPYAIAGVVVGIILLLIGLSLIFLVKKTSKKT
jgi:hypothetical protein